MNTKAFHICNVTNWREMCAESYFFLPVWSLHVLVCLRGFLPNTRRLTGDSKCPLGVNVSVNVCLSLHVHGEPRPPLMSAGIDSSPPTALQKDK